MPQYSRKSQKLFCKGMCLNRPIDAIPENEYAYLQNVRQYEDGRLDSRPGISLVSLFPAAGANDYIHSFLTLNDTNPDDAGGSKRFIGYNTDLYFSFPTFPATVDLVDSGFSGNPLSFIGMSPVDNPTPFIYVYDSLKQQKYSASYVTGATPTIYPVGIPQISVYQAVAPVPTILSGNITGNNYSWRWQLRHIPSGAKSIPGLPTRGEASLDHIAYSFSDPSITIGATLAVDQEYTWDLYRFGGTIQSWTFIGSVGNRSGGTIVDNFQDLDIEANPTLLTDPRSILYQPWLVPDVPKSGTVMHTEAAIPAASGSTGGIGSLVQSAGGFNIQWIPGTQIIIDGAAYTISTMVNADFLYIYEDLGGDLGTVPWKVDGALMAGAPLPYVWGPFGSGQFGLYLFACGDLRAPGTLYWTNGNDPDSVSLTGSLEITSSSEPLQNGCVWNGRVWVWSTERMWEIVPDLVNAGQFLAQVVPGARGLPQNWCFCVGDLIYFKSKDGIFSFGGGGLPQSLSDHQLYELLGHDGQNGFGATIPNPEDFANPITVQPPDPNRPAEQRLFWGDGVLYFDYIATDALPVTLVYDSHLMQGWTLDAYILLGRSRCHFSEQGAHTFFVAQGARLSWLTGDTDEGQGILCSIMTGADLLGDIRSSKLIGDAVVGAISNTASISAKILGNRNTTVLASGTLAISGAYTQTVLTINNAQVNQGINAFSPSVALWTHWSSIQRTSIYDWEPTWVPKPESITKRATDWTDDGLVGAKYLKGVVIESAIALVFVGHDLVVDGTNTQKVSSAGYTFSFTDVGAILSILDGAGGFVIGQATITDTVGGAALLDHPVAPASSFGGSFSVSGNRSVTIQIDGGITAQTITLAATQQSEYAYFIAPVVAHEMRVVPADEKTCQIFSVRYLWDAYPEYQKIKEDLYLQQWPSPKYIRGVKIEGDTQGAPVEFAIEYDNQSGPGLNLIQSGKTLTEIGFAVPFNAKEIRLIPLGNWRRHSVTWIYDDYPPFAALITTWEDCGVPGDKYMRGGVLRLETGNAVANLRLVNDAGMVAVTISVVANGQREIPFAVEPPVVGHLWRWEPVLESNSTWGYFRTRWDFDPYPEIYFERTAIVELGRIGAKFMQGIKLTGDSGNQDSQFDILTDGGVVAYTSPLTKWNGKTTIPFSFAVPFIAHNLQLRPKTGGLRIFVEETEWVWEPAPDLATNWITQTTSFGLRGYLHHRDGYVALQAPSDAVLTITLDDGVVYTYPIPATGAAIKKFYIVFQPMKGKLPRYAVTSAQGLRLFQKDCEIKVKEWGSAGQYQVMRPFGDTSFEHGARL